MAENIENRIKKLEHEKTVNLVNSIAGTSCGLACGIFPYLVDLKILQNSPFYKQAISEAVVNSAHNGFRIGEVVGMLSGTVGMSMLIAGINDYCRYRKSARKLKQLTSTAQTKNAKYAH